MINLTLGFSSCPNDTFIFDALVHKKIDTEGLDFEVVIGDVEYLNRAARNNDLNITKISYYAYALVSDQYLLLDSGSALGKNNGPLLVSKRKIYPDEMKDVSVAIPGENTTANLLLSVAYPQVKHKTEYLFSDIEEVVLYDEMDAGLIIHENRFTYMDKGLRLISDLGEYWEKETRSPIPLGGIAVHRTLDKDIQHRVNRVLRRSVEFAFQNPEEPMEYMRRYAQDMEEEIMRKHVELYVNDYTLELGKDGKKAINVLYEKAQKLGIIKQVNDQIFLT